MTPNLCTNIAYYIYATVLSFILISAILTKLYCFKHDNATVLTLSKYASTINLLRVSTSLELKRKTLCRVRVNVQSVFCWLLSTPSSFINSIV